MGSLGSMGSMPSGDLDDIVVLADNCDKKMHRKTVPQRKGMGKASTSKVVPLSDSESDEDFYSNMFQRKQKRVAMKKRKSPTFEESVAQDIDLDDLDNSIGVEDDDCELTWQEKVKLQIEKQSKQEKVEKERLNEAIRKKALMQFSTSIATNVYINPLVEDTKKDLRAIREMENQMNFSPEVRAKKPKLTVPVTEQLPEEKINVVIEDMEHPGVFRYPTYRIEMKETFENLRNLIAAKWDVDPVCVRLELEENATLIITGSTPTTLERKPDEFVKVTALIFGKRIDRKDPFDIELKCQIEGGLRTKNINVKKYMCFVDIKPLIMQAWNIPSITKLVFDAEEICDNETPESLDIEEGSIIDVYQ